MRAGHDDQVLCIAIRYVRADQVDTLRAWLATIGGLRREEALATLADERCAHEQAVLVEGSNGPVLVQAMEVADVTHSEAAASQSPHPIGAEHKAVMQHVLGDPSELRYCSTSIPGAQGVAPRGRRDR